MKDFCLYCNDVHDMIDFGRNLNGEKVLVCSDRLSDSLVKTMPKIDDDILEAEDLCLNYR